MIPEFIRFYGYTRSQVLGEYARSFFAMVNSMLELSAKEMLDRIIVNNTNYDESGRSTINRLERQCRGLDAIIEEVKIAKAARGG
jgi:hypothetical protein